MNHLKKVDESRALLGCYEASSGNSSPMFRDIPSVRYSKVQNPCITVKVCLMFNN